MESFFLEDGRRKVISKGLTEKPGLPTGGQVLARGAEYRMPNARPKTCPRDGCAHGEVDDETGVRGPYTTDPACKTLQEVKEDMADHIEQAHDAVSKQEVEKLKAEAELALAKSKEKEAEAKKVTAEKGGVSEAGSDGHSRGERRAPLKRPEIEEDCTESDWSFFVASWDRYVKACKLNSSDEISHLWSACSEALQKALHNQGAQGETDIKSLLERIRLLAVKKRNNLVNVIQFQQMYQERDEGVHGFLARLNGQAELCNLTVPCPEHGCEVSFKERFTMLQLVRGLQDLSIQERVLQEAAAVESGELSLTKVTKLVEAAEMGKSSQASISKAGGQLSRLSEHRRGKEAGKLENGGNNQGRRQVQGVNPALTADGRVTGQVSRRDVMPHAQPLI